jgi:hypothetical protein
MPTIQPNPRREARMRARVPMVRVAGTIGCSLQTVQRFELDPSSVRDDLRTRLEAAYAAFATEEAA